INDDQPYYYFYKGMSMDNMDDFKNSERNYRLALSAFIRAKSNPVDPAKDQEFNLYHYYLHLGQAQKNLKSFIPARGNLEKAAATDKTQALPLYLVALIQIEQERWNDAIKYLNEAILRDKQYAEVFLERGKIRLKLGEYGYAKDDLLKVLIINKEYTEANYYKGICHMELGEVEEAKAELNRAKDDANLMADVEIAQDIKHLLFELDREEVPPTLELASPILGDNNVLLVPKGSEKFTVSGKIKDDNLIKSIVIAGEAASYVKDHNNPNFRFDVSSPFKDSYSIVVKDVYDNEFKQDYTVNFHETDIPKVVFSYPNVSYDNKIYIDGDLMAIMVEGKVTDENKIVSIDLNGKPAKFDLDAKNPIFTANVPIISKAMKVEVVDIYGNKYYKEIAIVKGSAGNRTPMGKTLVVFIENSTYENLPSLDGPIEDYKKIQTALLSYNVDQFIHKKDMTKDQLNRFFQLELRDFIKQSSFKALMIWYAGHGKFQNDIGYWIPTDGKRDDEFTYYSTNELKGNLQAYQDGGLKHILVISDACESGPGFLRAMRDAAAAPMPLCDKDAVIPPGSVQVFTSSGYQLASDASVFTQKFAEQLNMNPSSCISINQIAEKVIPVIKNTNSIEPKFGPIKGLDDEGGQFIFYRR
ncbi:MAG: caspase family protein, partial [Bacteroidetes bacterium]|nr:caspase family protein [Bacteroidota bacterium]